MMEKSAVGVGDGGRVTVCETGTEMNVPSTISGWSLLALVFGVAIGAIGAPKTALRSLLIRGEGCLFVDGPATWFMFDMFATLWLCW